MNGDTGTKLPPELKHPSHWPQWDGDDTEEETAVEEYSPAIQPSPDTPFVFLSYSSRDRVKITGLKVFLEARGIASWWDQDIPTGGKWRETIAQKLETAACVLTFWTGESVQSPAVIEEASRAQSQNKLVHARLDTAPLPYGFSETLYASLTDWDGFSPNHPGMRKLLQALHDKLDPPKGPALSTRLLEASSLAFEARNGKLTTLDSPPHAAPPVRHPEDLKQRIAGQDYAIKQLLADLHARKFNVPREFAEQLTRYHSALCLDNPTWYALDDGIDAIIDCMDRHDAQTDWPDRLQSQCRRLISRHHEMEPLIRPKQIPLDQADAPRPAPQPDLAHLEQSPPAQEELLNTARQLNNSLASGAAKDVLDETTLQLLESPVKLITSGLAQQGDTEKDKSHRHSLLRRGLIKTAGIVAGLVTAISAGIATNVLTSPAAAVTLLTQLEQILAALLKLF
ncbi:toll/interleukin-1 receptor domain-containing protein [Kiloniella laminariae]|uniref:Toll/interleukin-1 receptor domain-containing protein n=1 Tax=Kiloniella laminariae TaxID=454162 RepID=A0ABT4LFN2_9PROT|nr:toll/interleukin-1 receptor domain-containing protein [Kiloniella laminariae]MCZ4279923.1 toll/interleukin-1 receptor domain-containing protein [Kiloniella laminariae]